MTPADDIKLQPLPAPQDGAQHFTFTQEDMKARKQNLWDDYFLHHVEPTGKADFYRVTTPLKVFKAAWLYGPGITERAIISMLIPINAEIFASSDQTAKTLKLRDLGRHTRLFMGPRYAKLRASKAYVESVNELTGRKVNCAFASYDKRFKYEAGKRVTPKKSFSRKNLVCTSGIHFFLTLGEAKSYV